MTLLLVLLLLGPAPALAQLTDSGTHLPPSSGCCPYSPPGTWLPGSPNNFPAAGQTYVDPVFGTTIRRLTSMWPGAGDAALYAKNGFWNADGTRLAYSRSATGQICVTNALTGVEIRCGLPGYGSTEVNFDPVDPDLWLYGSGSQLLAYHLSTGASTVLHDFGAALGPLGGSTDMVDASGRWIAVNAGGVLLVWDRQLNLVYANQGTISGAVGSGYASMVPDGSGVEKMQGTTLTWVPVDKAAHTLGPEVSRPAPIEGDHGDSLCASDGHCYHVFDTTEPMLRKVDLTAGGSSIVLDLRALSAWDDMHFSCVSRGPLRDWCVVATETNALNDLGSWSPWHQEIFMFNVLTGAVKRLAHHRSREILNYMRSPRVSANWDGTKVAFASSYGYQVGDYGDIYAVELGAPTPPPSPVRPAQMQGVTIQ